MPKGRGKRSYSMEQINKAFAVARLYYLEGKNQTDIQKEKELKLDSQTEVSRYLAIAKELGLITITINNPPHTQKLGNLLLASFKHLKEVKVIPVSESTFREQATFGTNLLQALGEEAAKYFLDKVKSNSEIGLSCGTTVSHVIEEIGNLVAKKLPNEPVPTGCSIFPLVIQKGPEIEGITPAALVGNLTRRLPAARGKAYHLPKDIDGHPLYSEHPAIIDLLKDLEDLDFYLVGVGRIDSGERHMMPRQTVSVEFNSLIHDLDLENALEKHDAQGEIALQPFSSKGKFLIGEPDFLALHQSILYMPLEILRKHVRGKVPKVVAVAGGKAKHHAIYAALKSRVFDVLITDSDTAAFLLEKEGKFPSTFSVAPKAKASQ